MASALPPRSPGPLGEVVADEPGTVPAPPAAGRGVWAALTLWRRPRHETVRRQEDAPFEDAPFEVRGQAGPLAGARGSSAGERPKGVFPPRWEALATEPPSGAGVGGRALSAGKFVL